MIVTNPLTCFMPMSHSKLPPRLTKPTYCGGKVIYNNVYANNSGVKVKDTEESSKKTRYHHAINKEEMVRKSDGVYDMFGGKTSQDGRVFKQNFAIRSYDVGCDGKASLGSLMKRMQEIGVQHSKSVGVLSGGIGSAPELHKRGLVWVIRKFQIDVEKYPSWDDIIQTESCCYASGDNGMIRDCVFSDYRTGEVVARPTSLNVSMNMRTRRFSKMEPGIKNEINQWFMVGDPQIDIKNTKLRQMDVSATGHVSQAGLTPSWSDLDINQYVSHVKYLDWLLQSLSPPCIDKNELCSIILEFRRECKMGDNLQSISAVAVSDGTSGKSTDMNEMQSFDHLLLHEDGSAILRGKTVWKAPGDGKTSPM